MQGRIGKKRCIGRAPGVGKRSFTGFKGWTKQSDQSEDWSTGSGRKTKVFSHPLILASLLILNSCSSLFKTNEIRQNEVKNFFQKVCLSSEGKGRIKSKAGKHLFRYESALDVEANQWDMALQLPVHGERLITLSWTDLGTVKIKGSFYGQLMASMQKDKNFKREKALLKRFLRFLSMVARLKTKTSQNRLDVTCSKRRCIAQNESFSWYHSDSESLIKQNINDRMTLILKGVSASNNYFKKLTFMVENTGNSYRGGHPLVLNLFLASCDSEK